MLKVSKLSCVFVLFFFLFAIDLSAQLEWVGAQDVSTGNGVFARVDMNNSDHVVATWIEGTALLVSHSSDKGINWDTPITLDSAITASPPSVSIDDLGQAVIVIPKVGDIFYAYSTDHGASWITSSFTPLPASGIPSTPIVKFNGSGSALLIWIGATSSKSHSRMSSDGGASWINEVQLPSIGSPSENNLTYDDSGNAILAFMSLGQVGTAYSTDNGLTWNPSSIFVFGAQNTPKVAKADGANAGIIWIRNNQLNYRNTIDFGANWPSPSGLLTNPGEVVLSHNIVMDKLGNGIVLVSNDIQGIQASYSSDAGANWTTQVISKDNNISESNVAMNENGFAVAIWNHNVNGIEISVSEDFGLAWSLPLTPFSDDASSDVSDLKITVNDTNHTVPVWRNSLLQRVRSGAGVYPLSLWPVIGTMDIIR